MIETLISRLIILIPLAFIISYGLIVIVNYIAIKIREDENE